MIVAGAGMEGWKDIIIGVVVGGIVVVSRVYSRSARVHSGVCTDG